MVWIYSVPSWFLFVSVVAGSCIAAGIGLHWFRFRREPKGEDITHNDVAGPIMGTVGTILAVVLSFMLITNWQQYDAAAQTVEQEAAAVADLYHLAAGFPQPLRGQLQSDLSAYINVVVDQEWPLMRHGGRSEAARLAALRIAREIGNYQSKTNTDQNLQQTAVNMAQAIEDERRLRLFDNDQGIPLFMWIGNIVVSMITIALCYFFKVRSRLAHFLMTFSLTIVIVVLCVITALIDYPFRGDTQIPPTLFMHLQQELGQTHSLDQAD